MDKVREEFEQLARSKFALGTIGFGLNEDGTYRDLYTRFMFDGYVAASEAKDNEVRELKSCMEDYLLDLEAANNEIERLKKQVANSIELIDTFPGSPNSAGDLTQLITEVMTTLTKDGE
jgi:hypothetical protein